MENTMCGARADFQTAGLNGVFAHFCRRGQKWVAPEREISIPPEAIRSGSRRSAKPPRSLTSFFGHFLSIKKVAYPPPLPHILPPVIG